MALKVILSLMVALVLTGMINLVHSEEEIIGPSCVFSDGDKNYNALDEEFIWINSTRMCQCEADNDYNWQCVNLIPKSQEVAEAANFKNCTDCPKVISMEEAKSEVTTAIRKLTKIENDSNMESFKKNISRKIGKLECRKDNFIRQIRRNKNRCPEPPSYANADVVVNDFRVNGEATVQCAEKFTASPRDVNTKIKCLKSLSWSTFNGSCVQVEFYSGEVPPNRTFPFPSPVSLNDQACVMGRSTTHHWNVINFILYNDLPTYYYHISFRSTHLVQNTKQYGQWGKAIFFNGQTMFKYGETFNISLNVADTELRLKINIANTGSDNVGLYSLPLDATRRVLGSTAFQIAPGIDIMYVNLEKEC